jgi:hypothetical protein
MATQYDGLIDDLLTEINGKQGVLETNQAYYDATYRLRALGLSTPPEMRFLTAAVGWPSMYVQSLEERLDVEDFRMGDQSEGDDRLRDWWQANLLDVESGPGHTEALVHGIAYVTVSAPNDDEDPTIPIIRLESPFNFIAKQNYRTRKVKNALRVYEDPEIPNEKYVALYLPNETVYLGQSKNQSSQWFVDYRVQHDLDRVLVSPLVNRARIHEWCGRSEISQELRSATDAASRIMMNLQSAAELMAIPQRILFGVSEEEFPMDLTQPGAAMDAYMARIMAFENESGKATQFNSADLRNYIEALQELAKQVASYTGLPPQYLSFSSENPASAEAIKSSEARLIKKVERKARLFGQSWEEAMRLGMLVIDGSIPQDSYKLETVWRDPSTPTFAAKSDGITKLHQQGIIPTEQARIDLGYSDIQRKEMAKMDKSDPVSQMNQLLFDQEATNQGLQNQSKQVDNATKSVQSRSA